MTLSDYRSIVAGLPAPTVPQMEGFARFVCEAHSWYKGLPLYRPGTRFCVFVDPFAGYDRVSSAGELRFAVREKQGFHYSAITTREYHERFGHLAYSWVAGKDAERAAAGHGRSPGNDIAAVANKHGRLRLLPPEIIRAGTVRLTAAVHPTSAACPWWDLRAPQDADEIDWPEESGGLEVLRKIFARCREVRETRSGTGLVEFDGELGLHLVDPVLHALLSPERERQQRTIAQAVHRVYVLLGGLPMLSPPPSEQPTSGATRSQFG
jgi:hypothetical protein